MNGGDAGAGKGGRRAVCWGRGQRGGGTGVWDGDRRRKRGAAACRAWRLSHTTRLLSKSRAYARAAPYASTNAVRAARSRSRCVSRWRTGSSRSVRPCERPSIDSSPCMSVSVGPAAMAHGTARHTPVVVVARTPALRALAKAVEHPWPSLQIPGRRPHVAERRVSSSSRYYYYYYSSVVVFVVCLLYQPVPVCVAFALAPSGCSRQARSLAGLLSSPVHRPSPIPLHPIPQAPVLSSLSSSVHSINSLPSSSGPQQNALEGGGE